MTISEYFEALWIGIFFAVSLTVFILYFLKYLRLRQQNFYLFSILQCSVFFIFTSLVYLVYEKPYYKSSTSILFEERKPTIFSLINGIQQHVVPANNTFDNIEVLKSRTNIETLVDKLSLQTTYFKKKHFLFFEIYGTEQSFTLEVSPNTPVLSQQDASFLVKILSSERFLIQNEITALSGEFFFNTPFLFDGTELQLNIANRLSQENNGHEFRIVVQNKEELISELTEAIEFSDYRSSLVTVSLEHHIEEKGVMILQNLLEVFENYQLDEFESNNTTVASLISQRLDTIQDKLTKTGKNIEVFKSTNIVTSNPQTVKDYISLKTEQQVAIPSLNQSLKQITSYIAFLEKHNTSSHKILSMPAFSVDEFVPQLHAYNSLVLERNIVSQSSFDDSPVLQQYTMQLDLMFANIIESLLVFRDTYALELQLLKKELAKTNLLLESLPKTVSGLNNYYRQQKVDENLYSYLKKKEEFTKYSLSGSIANFKIIDPAYVTGKPYNSNTAIMVFAYLFLIGYPFLLYYFDRKLEFTLQNLKGLKKIVSAPVLGDIPLSTTNQNIVVTSEDRSSTTEAFRLLRTNIDFMLSDNNNSCKSIFVTSTISSEGKSFVAVNLAVTMALKYKKVALVGVDLRAPKIANYLGVGFKKGITNYIMDTDLTLQDISFPFPKQSNLDVFASGIIPPNPSELLNHQRLVTFFEELKSNYDCVVVDTAPVNLVSDTLKIAHYADMFVYVCRANYTDKRLLTVAETIFKEARLPNMAMLINASDPAKGNGAYGTYGYGTTNADKSNWKSFFLS